jgi:hypothetical protein
VIILDTDRFTKLQIGKGAAFNALSDRMNASPDDPSQQLCSSRPK